jgi:hypothetical protein
MNIIIHPIPTAVCLGLLLHAGAFHATAQGPDVQYGQQVPAEVKQMYERGLNYLVETQQEDGNWPGSQTNGVTALCLMAFLASGEDPNFGRFSVPIRRATRSLILSQDRNTGFIPTSMYHHGFAMLALAEAYGAVDDSLLWDGQAPAGSRRSIGQALELALRCAITSQNNHPTGAWRYSPSANDADTSVSGAVLMGLLGVRNAGLEVRDENIDRALRYFQNSTSDGGIVAYSSGGGLGDSMNRSAIAALVYAVGKKKDWPAYDATLNYLTNRLDYQPSSWPHYFRYYMAQALFQADFESWTVWNRENTRLLRGMQQDNGSFESQYGPAYGTSMALLSLALNYRFLPIYER